MTLRVILGAVLGVVGSGGVFLGILFLIASRGEGSRLAAGAILGLGGLALLIGGIINFRKGSRFSPGGIRKSLFKLARMRNGEVTGEEITGELGDSADVMHQVNNLILWGIARETLEGNRKKYIFSDFQTRIILKKCPYCGNDYPVRDDIQNCPSCGGDLKIDKGAIAGGKDKFSMDEGDD